MTSLAAAFWFFEGGSVWTERNFSFPNEGRPMCKLVPYTLIHRQAYDLWKHTEDDKMTPLPRRKRAWSIKNDVHRRVSPSADQILMVRSLFRRTLARVSDLPDALDDKRSDQFVGVVLDISSARIKCTGKAASWQDSFSNFRLPCFACS